MKTGAYITLLLLILKSNLSFSQWQSLGPNWAQINCNLQFENRIFIGTLTSGIFASDDNGRTWKPKNTGLSSTNISSIIIKNGRLYVGSSNNGDIFYSDNFGESWHLFSTLPGKSSSIIFINDSGFFIGAYGGLYRSSNNGFNWNRVDSGISFPQFFTIRCMASHRGAIYVGTNTGIHVSYNMGISWKLLNNGIPTNASFFSLLDFNNKLFGVSSFGCFVSENNGEIWTKINVGLSDTLLSSLLVYKGDLITPGSNRDPNLYKLDTLLSKWEILSNFPPSNGKIYFMNSFQEDLVVLSEYGIYRNNFNPDVWEPSNNGFHGFAISNIEPINDLLYAKYFYNGGLAYRFDSSIWSPMFLKPYQPSSFLNYENKIFASFNDAVNLGVGYSLDTGKTWIQSNTGINHKKGLLIATLGKNIFYASSLGGVYMSKNKGGNWLQINDSLLDPKLNFAYSNKEDFFVVNSRGVYSLDTTKLIWNLIFAPLNDTLLVVGGNKLNLLCQGTKGLLYKIINNGQQTTILEFDSTIKVNCIRFVNEILFMGTNKGLFLSKDSGYHWQPANWGMYPETIVFDIKYSTSQMFCATNFGVWQRDLDKLTGIKQLLTSSKIIDCYPNPANHQINFSFGSNQTQIFSYTIYDLSGKLIGKKQQLNGTIHGFEINVESLSPSIYFISIETNIGRYQTKFIKQ
jgi:hypothetical protein